MLARQPCQLNAGLQVLRCRYCNASSVTTAWTAADKWRLLR